MESSPRKIVLILGNGFDLDLGLHTSYKDFWESNFCPKNYPAPLIKHLNQQWPEDLDKVKWYDLENELLNYYISRKDNPDYPDVVSPELLEYVRGFNDYEYTSRSVSGIDKEMQELLTLGYATYNKIPAWAYIPLQDDFKQSQSWRDQQAFQLIKKGLCDHLKSIEIPRTDRKSMAHYLLVTMENCLEEKANGGCTVEIFTFNYTPVRMNGHSLGGIPVHHMHGSCEDGNIIVGTRDDPDMSESYDFLQKAMDDAFNPPDIVSALKDADEVIIFGHSLGENDRQYFAPFFLRQSNYDNPIKKDITIFTRDNNSEREIKRSLNKMTSGKLSGLYSVNQPVIIKTACINEEKDQQLLFDFLLNHNTEKRDAYEIINRLTAAL